MLEEILREIEEMEYPSQGIGCGLEDIGITDRYDAAAYGFGEAQGIVMEIIRSHMDDGWIPCGERLPEEPGDGEWLDRVTAESYPVAAWYPFPVPYHPRHKSVGEDYKQRVMERFMKVE